jgi:glycosyltransferase involved in cell wall biosynthesis
MITAKVPFHISDGQTLRVINLAKAYKKNGHTVSLFIVKSGNVDKKQVEEVKKGDLFEKIYVNEGINRSYSGRIIGLFNYSVKNYIKINYSDYAEDLNNKLDDIIRREKITGLHIFSSLLGLMFIDSHKNSIVDLCDSYGYNFKLEIATSNFYKSIKYRFLKNRMDRQEKYLISHYLWSAVVSEVDREYLIQMHGNANKIVAIPNGIDADFFNPVKAKDYSNKDSSMLFIGNLDFPPNADAVKYLIDEIMPGILKKHPNTTLFIVGKGSNFIVGKGSKIKEYNTLNGKIVFTGFVEDIVEYYASNIIFIAPMRKGGGIKNKILEAMAMENCVITTDIASGAFNSQVEKNLIVCKDTDDIVNESIYYLNNINSAILNGKKNRELVLKYYSWNTASLKYIDLFEKKL